MGYFPGYDKGRESQGCAKSRVAGTAGSTQNPNRNPKSIFPQQALRKTPRLPVCYLCVKVIDRETEVLYVNPGEYVCLKCRQLFDYKRKYEELDLGLYSNGNA